MHTTRAVTLIGGIALALVACGDNDPLPSHGGATDAGFDGAQPPDQVEDDAGAGELDAGDGTRRVSIRFKAKVGDEELVCGRTYASLGSSRISGTPQDFRFFVQDLRLVREDGSEERVELDSEAPYQRQEVGLIDFTDGAGACGGSGNSSTNTTLTGRVPAGDYVGIVFVNGVPEELNHAGPAETAQPPLDDVTLFWSWLSGYRFTIAELLPVRPGGGLHGDAGAHGDASVHGDASTHDSGTQAEAGAHDAGMHAKDGGTHGSSDGAAGGGMHGGGHAASEAAFVHIGSSACSGSQSTAFSCARQARNEIRLMGFDPDQDVVIADLAEIFKDSDLNSPLQCHGIAAPCARPYAALGIDMDTGQKTSTQRVFRVE